MAENKVKSVSKNRENDPAQPSGTASTDDYWRGKGSKHQ